LTIEKENETAILLPGFPRQGARNRGPLLGGEGGLFFVFLYEGKCELKGGKGSNSDSLMRKMFLGRDSFIPKKSIFFC